MKKDIIDTFEKGPEAWCSYEYHASVISDHGVFIRALWSKTGGPNDGGYIWVHRDNSRWHMTSRPLEIATSEWADESQRFTLKNDESLWTQTWSPHNPSSLNDTLESALSYGLSFVGFARAVLCRAVRD